MPLTVYELATGRIRYRVENPEGWAGAPGDSDLHSVAGLWETDTHYVLDGEPTPRPVTGLPPSYELPAHTDWPLPDVPEGTTVLIDGEEAGTVDATGLTLSFALAGIWRVDLRPQFPWLDATCEVTVA